MYHPVRVEKDQCHDQFCCYKPEKQTVARVLMPSRIHTNAHSNTDIHTLVNASIHTYTRADTDLHTKILTLTNTLLHTQNPRNFGEGFFPLS